MSWYISAMKKYADFKGRARRMEYWFLVLFNAIFMLIAAALGSALGALSDGAGFGVFIALYSLAMIVPWWAVAVRRLHDTDRSGWWILIQLIPVVGSIWFFILLLLDGQAGENRFGADPKLA